MRQYSPVGGLRLRKVYFMDANKGYIAGDKIILKTINGGESWYELNTGVPHDFLDIAILDNHTLLAVGSWTGDGDASEAGGVVIRSRDSGRSWDEIIRNRWGDDPGRHFFTALQFINEQTGWMLGGTYMDNFNSTYLYETVDGGISWNIISEIPQPPVSRLSARSASSFWVGGFGGAVSTNQGLTWEKFDFTSPSDTIFTLPGNVILDFEQVSDYQMYALVCKLGGSDPRLVHTTDAAGSWRIESLPDSANPMHALDKYGGKVWMVGKDGVIFYTPNIVTGITNEYNNSNKIFVNLSVYPNPFNSVCNLKVRSNEEDFITLTIFNSLGEKVVDLENTTRIKDEHQVVFDPGSMKLPSGIYFVTLTTTENFKAAKLIYLK